MRNNDAQTVGQGIVPTFQSAMFRVIVWTPRVDYTIAAQYMGAVTLTALIDFDVVTVHKDWRFELNPAYMSEATTADLNANGHYERIFKGTMRFPRKVRFTSDGTSLNPNKDICYYTVYTGLSHLRFSMDSKLWYYDT